MGRSSARAELLNFLQTSSLSREKADSLQCVYMQTVSDSSEMLEQRLRFKGRLTPTRHMNNVQLHVLSWLVKKKD